MSSQQASSGPQVLVVGAGPLGAASARHLAMLGASVTLVGPEEPSTWRGHHGLWSGHYDAGRCAAVDVPFVASLLGVRAMRRFRALEAQTGIGFATTHPILNVVPQALPAGQRHLSDWLDLDALLANSADLSWGAEALDEDELRDRFAQLHLPTGYRGVLQENAFLVDPRALVRAEISAAQSLGARVVREEAVGIDDTGTGVVVRTKEGSHLQGDLLLLATGAFTNANRLLSAELDVDVFGCTLVLLEVDAEDEVSFPAVLPYLMEPDLQYAGVVMPPRLYPDGRRYVKATGPDMLATRLEGYEAIGEWVRTGGSEQEAARACAVLAQILPGVSQDRVSSRPCLPTMNASHQPYVDLVSDRMGLVCEGERGVMLADELGRLAARMLLAGRWDDPLPGELFAARFKAS